MNVNIKKLKSRVKVTEINIFFNLLNVHELVQNFFYSFKIVSSLQETFFERVSVIFNFLKQDFILVVDMRFKILLKVFDSHVRDDDMLIEQVITLVLVNSIVCFYMIAT